MSRAALTFLLVLFAIAAVVGYLALFTVQQTQQALVLQFGNPIRVINAPGGLTPAKEGAAEETGGQQPRSGNVVLSENHIRTYVMQSSQDRNGDDSARSLDGSMRGRIFL